MVHLPERGRRKEVFLRPTFLLPLPFPLPPLILMRRVYRRALKTRERKC